MKSFIGKLEDLTKAENCVICDRKIDVLSKKHCFCVKCFNKLPKEIHVKLKQAEKDDNIEEVDRLTKKGIELLHTASRLKKADTCLICGKKLKGFQRSPISKALCLTCDDNQPEKWREEIIQASNEKRYDHMQKLLDVAVKGDFDYGLEDLLSPKYGSFEYKGGHPNFSALAKVSLTDTPEGIVAFDNKSKNVFFTIEWDRITSISADSETVKKGSSGLTAMGVAVGRSDLALLSAVGRTVTNNFLNIGYKASGLETTISFEGKLASEAVAYYISRRSKYITDHKQEEAKPDDQHQVSPDPVEQIKKLAELKEAGILTEEEFEDKKKKLLSEV